MYKLYIKNVCSEKNSRKNVIYFQEEFPLIKVAGQAMCQ